MALQKSLVSPHGLPVSACYVKISSFAGDKAQVSVTVQCFYDEQSRLDGKLPLWTESFEFANLENGATMSQMYAVLKTVPQFNGALDV